jgi:hypothetical protein
MSVCTTPILPFNSTRTWWLCPKCGQWRMRPACDACGWAAKPSATDTQIADAIKLLIDHGYKVAKVD